MSAININKNNFENEVLNSDKTVLLDFWVHRKEHARRRRDGIHRARPRHRIAGPYQEGKPRSRRRIEIGIIV